MASSKRIEYIIAREGNWYQVIERRHLGGDAYDATVVAKFASYSNLCWFLDALEKNFK